MPDQVSPTKLAEPSDATNVPRASLDRVSEKTAVYLPSESTVAARETAGARAATGTAR